MPYAYATLSDVKARLNIDATDTDDDVFLRAACEAATRMVDEWCRRRFQPRTATRTYTAYTPASLRVDDLLSVTTLATLTSNSSGTRTYGDTWATTDYDLHPSDAPDDEEPYFLIRRNPAGNYSFPTDDLGVRITGLWGYWLDTVSVATAAEALDTTETGITVSDGRLFKVLQTILIDSEQCYVTAITGNDLTVDRAQHGTTAASHSDGASISRYRYPAAIVEATTLQAVRLWRRTDAPFGIAGAPEIGQVSVLPRIDPDVQMLVAPYRRLELAAV